jgi:Organic solute transporter Ostalpha
MPLFHGSPAIVEGVNIRLGYRFYRSATYYEFGLQAYESIVVASFLILICNFLGNNLQTAVKSKTRQRLIFPLNCIHINPGSWVTLSIKTTFLMASTFWRL